MVWFREFGVVELVLSTLFGLGYALFIWRNARVARRLRTRGRAVWVKFVLRVAYFALLLVALLGPSFGEISREVKAVGKDIYLLVDLSQSMDATDVPPSRLEKVKFELKNLAEAFQGDRIGLIVFSKQAFTQCPLTFDQNALNIFIESLSTELVPRAGTDFAPALRMALQKLEDSENTAVDQQAKVIVLVSDGEDFGGETLEEARNVERVGIRLFTLGVGTEAGSRIPVGNGYKRGPDGETVVSRLKAGPLRDLAARTGGDYFEITSRVNESEQLVRAIGAIEGQVRDARLVDVTANRFEYFLLPALLLVCLDLLFTVKIVRVT